MKINSPNIVVIGAGPAGLMAAEVLSDAGLRVQVYDAMPSAGRKLLMAGKGGLNITHAENFDTFVTRYGSRQNFIEPMLRDFSPDNLRTWLSELGISSFVGTSGRVFPHDSKAAPLLRAWLHRLRVAGVKFHTRHRWLGWQADGALRFVAPTGEIAVHADALVLALGGGSWARLGSTGEWVALLQQRGVTIAPLKPANCGFNVAWTAYFKKEFAGQPLKTIRLDFVDSAGVSFSQQGDIMMTEQGVEGGLIYAASALLREEISKAGHAIINLDLAPDQTLAQLLVKLSASRGKLSLSNFLRKRLKLTGVKANLLREILSRTDCDNYEKLAATIKALPLTLLAPRPLDEAISSAGGVAFEAMDENLMLRALPSVFCAGEMLDWEAPTGGYLLTACFASGRVAGLGAIAWLRERA